VIADRADCDPKTARKYLGWFANLGIVTRHDGHPATYERDDAFSPPVAIRVDGSLFDEVGDSTREMGLVVVKLPGELGYCVAGFDCGEYHELDTPEDSVTYDETCVSRSFK
jgi:hypothetical protein